MPASFGKKQNNPFFSLPQERDSPIARRPRILANDRPCWRDGSFPTRKSLSTALSPIMLLPLLTKVCGTRSVRDAPAARRFYASYLA